MFEREPHPKQKSKSNVSVIEVQPDSTSSNERWMLEASERTNSSGYCELKRFQQAMKLAQHRWQAS